MKNNKLALLTLLTGSVLCGGCFTSCVEDAIDGLDNVFKAPSEISINGGMSVVKHNVGTAAQIVNGKRVFTLKFTSDKGDQFEFVCLSGKYYLSSAGYSLSPVASAEDPNASANSYLPSSTVNGKQIKDGTLQVIADKQADGSYLYSVGTCNIFDVEGNVYKIKGTQDGGKAAFLFDPDSADEVTYVLNVNKMESGFVTLDLTTPGYEFTNDGWPPIYKGTAGTSWTIKFVSADGRIEAGDYAPNTGYVPGSCAFIPGAMAEAFGFGFNKDCFFPGGTCMIAYSGKDEVPGYADLQQSIIHVEREGTFYHIFTDPTAEAWLDFKGEIELITPGVKLGEDYKLEKIFSANNEAIKGEGLHFIDLAMSFGDVAAADGGKYTGTGRILSLRLQSEAGKVAPGDYALVKSSTDFKKNTCMVDSSYLTIVNEGDVTMGSLENSKIKVSYDEASKLYTIFVQCGEDTYTYVGDLAELDPTIELWSCVKTTEGNVVTINCKQDGLVAEMQLVLNTADGTLANGVYTLQTAAPEPMTYVATDVDWSTFTATGKGTWVITQEGILEWVMDTAITVTVSDFLAFGAFPCQKAEIKVKTVTYVAYIF